MMAKPNPKAKMKRVWIDSQTEEEIRRGINEAKDLSEYDSLSNSAFLRAKEDYLIGINFSRLLSIIFGRKLAQSINEEKASISIGRVMTCVLGMIVSREREIRNFVKTKYYKLNSSFENFTAEWKVNPKSSVFESPKLYNETGFKKEEDAKALIDSLQGKKAVITELKKSRQKILTEYIRHQIHHPENRLNTHYTQAELKESIELMRTFIALNMNSPEEL